MSKKILAVYYSQSGQLSEIVEHFITPFTEAGMSVEVIRISMELEFSFPWTSERFFDVMPESVLAIPSALRNFKPQESKYDLIVFAYQPWYLSPSIPATSILCNEIFKQLLPNTPVVTLIGARNMWLNAQEKVKASLTANGAKHVANISLTDENNNFVSAITILHWMLSGRKDKFLGIFPKPGISEPAILNTSNYGKLIVESVLKNDFNSLQEKLVAVNAVSVKSNLMFIEARAGKLFSIWAKLIIKKKNRRLWLILFKYYLFIALFLIAPIVLTVYMLIFKPFLRRQIEKRKRYYLGLR